jgi:hypothetical protein
VRSFEKAWFGSCIVETVSGIVIWALHEEGALAGAGSACF